MKLDALSHIGQRVQEAEPVLGCRWFDEKETVSLVKVDIDEPVLLRADEVSRLLQIGRTMTFQLIANGDLPVIRIGRAVRVPRSELQRWIRARTVER